MAKRLLCTLAVPVTVCTFAWLAGFNFNHRGLAAVMVFYAALAGMLIVYTRPEWSRK